MLLRGQDEITLTLRYASAIRAFEAIHADVPRAG